jgi:glutaminase
VDYARILREIAEEVRPLVGQGRAAEYIPPLARVPRDRFGMVVRTVDGEVVAVGDAGERFSIQSIAKVFGLTLAMRLEGDAGWTRVGREPSGSASTPSSSSRSSTESPGTLHQRGRARRPRPDPEPPARRRRLVLDFVRHAGAESPVGYDAAVAAAERATGHRNRALAHFLKSFGNLGNDPDRVLDAYFLLCSISMSCAEIAAAFQYLATGGLSATGERVATERQVKRVNAVMLTCGVYDEAGDYAYRVGLPAKSGVGGGVVAVMPGRFVATVWSPCLSEKGNSLAGTMALELLTTKTALSIF